MACGARPTAAPMQAASGLLTLTAAVSALPAATLWITTGAFGSPPASVIELYLSVPLLSYLTVNLSRVLTPPWIFSIDWFVA